MTDRPDMPHGRRTSLGRRIAELLPKRRQVQVLVLVQTVRGPVAVPVPKKKLL